MQGLPSSGGGRARVLQIGRHLWGWRGGKGTYAPRPTPLPRGGRTRPCLGLAQRFTRSFLSQLGPGTAAKATSDAPAGASRDRTRARACARRTPRASGARPLPHPPRSRPEALGPLNSCSRRAPVGGAEFEGGRDQAPEGGRGPRPRRGPCALGREGTHTYTHPVSEGARARPARDSDAPRRRRASPAGPVKAGGACGRLWPSARVPRRQNGERRPCNSNTPSPATCYL